MRIAITIAKEVDLASGLKSLICLADSVREIVSFLVVIFDESSTIRYVFPVSVLCVSLLSASAVKCNCCSTCKVSKSALLKSNPKLNSRQ